jgi:phospholipase C
MLENRSFDSVLGFLYTKNKNVSSAGDAFDGLTGDEYNLNGDGKKVHVFPIKADDKHAYFYPGADPGEGYFNTNSQLYGKHEIGPDSGGARNDGFIKNFAYTLNWEGREDWSILPGTRPEHIMGIYTPEMLPVLSGLARGYAVCDHWYASVPTETLPNRAFLAMATSQGRLTDKNRVYTAPSIFKQMENKNIPWAIYGYDNPPLSRTSIADISHLDNSHFGLLSDFKNAVANNTLANYVFLEPSWGKNGNSQHPNYDVAKGEQFLHEIYYTLYGSPVWEKCMLIITYDEHGGCYDHVPPPTGAVPPDNCVGQFGFDFKRFGPRVPTVIVSPRIAAGTVHRVPESTTPFDHTSILATLEIRFDLTPLTARDAAAPHIGNVITLDEPRTDDPLSSVAPPKSGTYEGDNSADHLQHLYADIHSELPIKDAEGYRFDDSAPKFKDSNEALEYGAKRYHQYYGD